MPKIKILLISITLVVTALIFYILGTVYKTNAVAGENFKFSCIEVGNQATRCENVEVVCYILRGGPGVSCVKK